MHPMLLLLPSGALQLPCTFLRLDPQQLPPLPAHIDAFTAFLNSKKATYAAFASAAFTLDIM